MWIWGEEEEHRGRSLPVHPKNYPLFWGCQIIKNTPPTSLRWISRTSARSGRLARDACCCGSFNMGWVVKTTSTFSARAVNTAGLSSNTQIPTPVGGRIAELCAMAVNFILSVFNVKNGFHIARPKKSCVKELRQRLGTPLWEQGCLKLAS